ncbi:hypothetical protein B0I31_104182 [Saccharothrix carnea]|uniref:Uncharacterized protein n=1 Tax=Saccharothrix carnea TaxID=1280637 RepID=A0A2P8IBQ1_SACCR|nr:hypothetical protein [Saccharothrix carnea]PSL55891.1 hypothetical protein B0I31_104182 [Saccharothrix carnea]
MKPTYHDITSCDLWFELTAAGDDLRYYRERGDHATVELMVAWIDVLLDEWNRRAGR